MYLVLPWLLVKFIYCNSLLFIVSYAPITCSTVRPVGNHLFSTIHEIIKFEMTESLLASFKSMVGHEHDSGILSVKHKIKVVFIL